MSIPDLSANLTSVEQEDLVVPEQGAQMEDRRVRMLSTGFRAQVSNLLQQHLDAIGSALSDATRADIEDLRRSKNVVVDILAIPECAIFIQNLQAAAKRYFGAIDVHPLSSGCSTPDSNRVNMSLGVDIFTKDVCGKVRGHKPLYWDVGTIRLDQPWNSDSAGSIESSDGANSEVAVSVSVSFNGSADTQFTV